MTRDQDMQALGALGGRAKSKAKAAALAALHEARRGVRRRPALANREAVLGDLHAALAAPIYGLRSIRACAAKVGVSDRTLRRWLSGEDWPNAVQLRAVQAWLRSLPS